jgi:FkbM family methyltransferase
MHPTIKKIGKRVLPQASILFYHSLRAALKLGILGPLFRTQWNAARKVRLGDEGGWTIPRSLLRESSICYCIGCGEDITFDLELIRRASCTVFAFDPTPRAIAHVAEHAANVPNYKFYEFAIWDKEDTVKFYVPPIGVSHSITNLEGTDAYIEVPTKRLKQVLESNAHAAIALLKMDIEGAEHTVIRTIVEDQLQIDVLCVEFDELAKPTPERLAAIKRSIRSLLDFGYDYFWIEGSNFTFVRQPR